MNNVPKRKTRAQRKALIVGIVSAFLTICFSIGIIISAVNIPHRAEIDNEYRGGRLQALRRIENGYVLTSTKHNQNKEIIDGVIYIYNDEHHLECETSLFNDANTKFGISDLNAVDNCFPIQETDSLYVTSDKYVFHYRGLTSRELTLEGYKRFDDRIETVASSETDLYVVFPWLILKPLEAIISIISGTICLKSVCDDSVTSSTNVVNRKPSRSASACMANPIGMNTRLAMVVDVGAP